MLPWNQGLLHTNIMVFPPHTTAWLQNLKMLTHRIDTNTKLKKMKTKSQFWRKLLFASLMLVGTGLVFTACDDDDELGALPSLNISNETAQNATSNTVSTTVSFDASEGAKELVILKNV